MAKFIILGSGSGFAVSERFCTSIACLVGNDCYLFDCGEPAGASLFRNGIDPLAIKSIFISHLHPDHIGGLAPVLFSMYLPGRSKEKKFKPWSITRYDDWYRDALWFPKEVIEEDVPRALELYLPGEGVEGIRTYLNTVYLQPEVLPFDIQLKPVDMGQFYEDDQITVSAVENAHLKVNKRYNSLPKKYPAIQFQSYSFLIEVNGKGVLFSGDIDNLDELIPFMDRTNIVIVEMAHHDPARVKPFFDQHDLDLIVLTHIHPGLEKFIKDIVAQWGDPKYQIAYDSFEIDL